MNYWKNVEIWSIVIYRQTGRQRKNQRKRHTGEEREIHRERQRDMKELERKRQMQRGRERDRQIMRVLINNPFVMCLVKLVSSNFHLK